MQEVKFPIKGTSDRALALAVILTPHATAS